MKFLIFLSFIFFFIFNLENIVLGSFINEKNSNFKNFNDKMDNSTNKPEIQTFWEWLNGQSGLRKFAIIIFGIFLGIIVIWLGFSGLLARIDSMNKTKKDKKKIMIHKFRNRQVNQTDSVSPQKSSSLFL
jgi:hypothetical protein